MFKLYYLEFYNSNIYNFLFKADNEEQPIGNKLVNMENRFTTVEEQLASLDNGFSRQVNNLTSRITTLESEVGELQEKINLYVIQYSLMFII